MERRLAGAARVGNHKTSMLQDIEAGREPEVEALLGALLELGEQDSVLEGRAGPTVQRTCLTTYTMDHPKKASCRFSY